MFFLFPAPFTFQTNLHYLFLKHNWVLLLPCLKPFRCPPPPTLHEDQVQTLPHDPQGLPWTPWDLPLQPPCPLLALATLQSNECPFSKEPCYLMPVCLHMMLFLLVLPVDSHSSFKTQFEYLLLGEDFLFPQTFLCNQIHLNDWFKFSSPPSRPWAGFIYLCFTNYVCLTYSCWKSNIWWKNELVIRQSAWPWPRHITFWDLIFFVYKTRTQMSTLQGCCVDFME